MTKDQPYDGQADDTSIEQLEADLEARDDMLREVLPVLRKNGYRTMVAKVEKLLGDE